jgi:hypothetical protein
MEVFFETRKELIELVYETKATGGFVAFHVVGFDGMI